MLSLVDRRRVNSTVRCLNVTLMKRFISRLLTITVTISFVLCSMVACSRSRNAAPPLLSNSLFERTGTISGFKEAYRRRSDGVIIRFHCSDRASGDAALALVRNQRDAGLVDHTDVFDGGSKVGERFVWDSPGAPYGAEIRWNNGARLFAIHAASLTDAQNFETSRAWVGGGCWDARSW